MDLLQDVLAQEAKVWQALVAGDAGADAALLAPEFLGLYPSGYAGRDDHAAQLQAGPTVAQYAITQARVMALREDLALLSYLATYARPGATRSERMWVSSIWERREGRWINLFSQDTPCDAPFASV